MCGRYAATASVDLLEETFEIDEIAGPMPAASYNVAPTDDVPAVVERVVKGSAEQMRKLVPLRWGLVPSWAKDATGGARMINARLETVATKPAFKTPFAKRRCLLPAAGYYEWYAHQDEQPGAKRPRKQPFFIRPIDGRLLVMAGLYEFWRDGARPKDDPDAWVSSCTIITTAATDALGHIHDRMPLVVHRDDWAAWLDPTLTDAQDVLPLLSQPVADLEAYAVSPLVNTVQNNGPELIEPLADAGAEAAPHLLG